MQHRIQRRKYCQQSDERGLCRRFGEHLLNVVNVASICFVLSFKFDFHFKKTTLQALSIINQFSPNPRDCKLTLGNDQLRYYHTFFGVHRESPYQAQLRLG